MASIRPKTPAEIRSSRSTPSGSRCQIRSALYLTRGKYRSTRRLRKGVVGCSLNSRQSSVTSTSSLVVIPDLHVDGLRGATSCASGGGQGVPPDRPGRLGRRPDPTRPPPWRGPSPHPLAVQGTRYSLLIGQSAGST